MGTLIDPEGERLVTVAETLEAEDVGIAIVVGEHNFGFAERTGPPWLAIAGDEPENLNFADPAEAGGKGRRLPENCPGPS